ncbi:hypothetical protein ACFV0T_28385 [Streptomyces sp. NPDC059582]|uniref:hypothetical protein n=1 Tax=Streptomyces sp. NPDC059582 TaxID=3346875 RepID=UPI00367BD6E2
MSEEDLHRLRGRHSREARRLQESIDRRMSDQQVLEVLARDGFRGPRYDQFVNELVRYGISVLRGWMHSGFIFHLVAERGFGLNPHERDLERLASDSDLREQLAIMVVALALPRFTQRALVEGGWTYEGGASITTYFMGACLYDFPNEFRRCRTAEEREHQALRQQKQMYEDPVTQLSVAGEVLSKLEVLEHLNEIGDPRTQAVVALTIDGHSQEEIYELLGTESVRAVEAVLYRWRKRQKRDREAGDPHGRP